MLTLYTSTGACSLAPHIALEAAGLDYEVAHVDLRAKKVEDGSDYFAVNPKGAVPALKLNGGEVLTENAVILQYIGDQAGTLLPVSGLDRYRTLEWVNYVATEIHKGFGMLFNPAWADDARALQMSVMEKKLGYLDGALGDRDWLTGTFSIADGYLFTVLRWTDLFKVDLARWPNVEAYRRRVAARPDVARVLASEGLGG